MGRLNLILILAAINKFVLYCLFILTFAIVNQNNKVTYAQIAIIQNADLIKFKRVSKNTLFTCNYICEINLDDYFVVTNGNRVYIYAKK